MMDMGVVDAPAPPAIVRTVRQMAEDIVRREGGLVDDPDDRGGITNYGVSLRYAQGVGLDLDGDGDTDVDDILMVTPDRAVILYITDFFVVPGINRLPVEIQPQLFDIAVNSGPGRAIELLQRAINEDFITLDALFEDGRMGPKTRRAAEFVVEMTNDGGASLNNAVLLGRVRFFRELSMTRPSQQKFLRGWLARAKEFGT